jgi:hypothetical protein
MYKIIITPNPLSKRRTETALENITYKTEDLKSMAYEHYYFGKSKA